MKTCLDLSIGHRQSVIEIRGIREIPHTELIQPFERARLRFPLNHHIHIEFLRVHGFATTTVRGEVLLGILSSRAPPGSESAFEFAVRTRPDKPWTNFRWRRMPPCCHRTCIRHTLRRRKSLLPTSFPSLACTVSETLAARTAIFVPWQLY